MVTWTFEQANQLHQLWHEDVLSASEIGKVMGFSKNAILGKARRLNLPNKWHRMSEPKPKPDKIIKKKAHPLKPKVEKNFQPFHVHPNDMEDGFCYYVTKTSPSRYCGHNVKRGDYCDYHLKIMRPK